MDVLKHILFLLNVKFTSTFLRKLYMENPNNTNLLGFSNMLRFYGIDTQPGKITNKETFENEIIPFLTKLHDDFVVVEDDDVRLEGEVEEPLLRHQVVAVATADGKIADIDACCAQLLGCFVGSLDAATLIRETYQP